MATYTIDNRPKRLRPGDSVVFVVNGEECGYQAPVEEDWLARQDVDVFEALGMSPSEKASMTKRCFGYVSTDLAFWPTAKPRDFAAHCRLVNALYDLIEEREGKKTESRSGKATNEPGIFLGYDWAPRSEPLGTSTELNESTHESVEAACDDAADHGYDTCFVFKLYAVSTKKYTRKFVQED